MYRLNIIVLWGNFPEVKAHEKGKLPDKHQAFPLSPSFSISILLTHSPSSLTCCFYFISVISHLENCWLLHKRISINKIIYCVWKWNFFSLSVSYEGIKWTRRDYTIRFYNITNVHFIILIVMVVREIIYVVNNLISFISCRLIQKSHFREGHIQR